MATARELAPEEYEGVQAMFPDWFSASVQCTPGASFWPSLGQMRRADLVLVAEDDDGGVIGCGLIAAESASLDWMVTKPGRSGDAFLVVATEIVDRFGTGWGRVGNAALREEYVAASGGHLVPDDPDDPSVLRWYR
ncbi:hypothetical protein ACIGG9_16050 [Pseudonocardia alni]|uniref:hypothetical protein n=1 Tax=Pseudonocardia alni TaxID=33907 RepID=UPI0033E4434E